MARSFVARLTGTLDNAPDAVLFIGRAVDNVDPDAGALGVTP